MTGIMDRTPERYRETIKNFIVAYYNQRRWEIEQAFLGIQVPLVQQELLFGSALADQLSEIARAAAGQIEPSKDGFAEGVVYEGIQDLMERLFSSPVLGTYHIPAGFWHTELGQMVGRAMVWCSGDELITQAEAANLRGVTVQAINNAIRDGRLQSYVDPNSSGERQGRTLVSRSAVESM